MKLQVTFYSNKILRVKYSDISSYQHATDVITLTHAWPMHIKVNLVKYNILSRQMFCFLRPVGSHGWRQMQYPYALFSERSVAYNNQICTMMLHALIYVYHFPWEQRNKHVRLFTYIRYINLHYIYINLTMDFLKPFLCVVDRPCPAIFFPVVCY